MLQLRPRETKATFTGERLLNGLTNDVDVDVMGVVKLMREFDYPMPDLSRIREVTRQVEYALFTFKYVPARPEISGRVATMLWRQHTHCLSPVRITECVVMALLCLKRACARLPRDMRRLLLLEAFGEMSFVPFVNARRSKRLKGK